MFDLTNAFLVNLGFCYEMVLSCILGLWHEAFVCVVIYWLSTFIRKTKSVPNELGI